MHPPSFASLQPGAVFHGRYRVVRCIKAGGMGAVYEVLDAKTSSPRALKVMLPAIVEDGDLRARFELEARITGNVESDHIVRVSDAGIDEPTGTPFLVMDLLRGEELASALKRGAVMGPHEVVEILFQTALALDKTHSAGIVHRDLKPENLFLTQRDDGSMCVKILDFGVAKVIAQSAATGMTRQIGTPLYMSPEQIRGEGAIGPRSDLYALGHIAYAVLVGEPYWKEESKTVEGLFPLFSRIVHGLPESPVGRARRRRGIDLAPSFEPWFVRATASRPEDRFETAGASVHALAAALGVPLRRPAVGFGPVSAPASTSGAFSASGATPAPSGGGLAYASSSQPASQSQPGVQTHPTGSPARTNVGVVATSPAAAPSGRGALLLVAAGLAALLGTIILGVISLAGRAPPAPTQPVVAHANAAPRPAASPKNDAPAAHGESEAPSDPPLGTAVPTSEVTPAPTAEARSDKPAATPPDKPAAPSTVQPARPAAPPPTAKPAASSRKHEGIY